MSRLAIRGGGAAPPVWALDMPALEPPNCMVVPIVALYTGARPLVVP